MRQAILPRTKTLPSVSFVTATCEGGAGFFVSLFAQGSPILWEATLIPMLPQLFRLTSILASCFWFTNIMLIALAKGRRRKTLVFYVTLFLVALWLFDLSAAAALPGVPSLYALVGTLTSLAMIVPAGMAFWCLCRIRGMQDVLARTKGAIQVKSPASTGAGETATLIEWINGITLGFTLSILLGSVLVSAVGEYSIPLVVIVVLVLSLVYVWSGVACHLADDETKLRVRFAAFVLIVTVFSICLSIVVVSYLWLHGVELATAAMIAATIGVVPFVYVDFLDRIKDRLFPTGTARRALALNMVALHERAILILVAETIVLSDVPAFLLIVSSGNMSGFPIWVESFLVFVAAMIFHFTRSTYRYLIIGGLMTTQDIQSEIARAVRRSVRFR